MEIHEAGIYAITGFSFFLFLLFFCFGMSGSMDDSPTLQRGFSDTHTHHPPPTHRFQHFVLRLLLASLSATRAAVAAATAAAAAAAAAAATAAAAAAATAAAAAASVRDIHMLGEKGKPPRDG